MCVYVCHFDVDFKLISLMVNANTNIILTKSTAKNNDQMSVSKYCFAESDFFTQFLLRLLKLASNDD